VFHLVVHPKEEYVSFDIPDANITSDPQQPIYVNSLGRFYSGAQITILLHELAHKVQPPGFIPIDSLGAPEGTSEQNSQTIIKHCADAINALKLG
jgi:hypothetical protein